jgi:hypothetical protein
MPKDSPFERIDPVRESAEAGELMPALPGLDLTHREYAETYRPPGWSPAEEQTLQLRNKLALGDKTGAGLDLAGLLVALAGAGAGGKGMQKVAKGKHASPFVSTKPEISGSKDLLTRIPATVGGKSPAHWGADDMERFGAHFGVEGMGQASKLVDIKDLHGKVHKVPEVFLTDGRPSYWDTLALKAAGIDPNALPEKLRGQIHDGMVRAVTPQGRPTDEHVLNGLLFGATSPNNPLTPNEVALSRTMVKGPGDVERLIGMVPWSMSQAPGVPGGAQSDRVATWSPQIARLLGLQAGDKGGLGTTGSVDWSRIPDMAALHQSNPDFFRFQGEHTPQAWAEHVQKVASQIPGLAIKTASLGSVWQQPEKAAISAIDRHMIGLYRGAIMGDQKAQAEWEKMVLGRFNEARDSAGKPRVSSMDEMLETPGGRGVYNDNAFVKLNAHLEPKFRLKSGEINPNIPDFMKTANWAREPEKVLTTSPAYVRALEANAGDAAEKGRSIFSQQWGVWDPIRQRFEPHEVMNPDLSKIGRLSHEQLRESLKTHGDAGYLTSPGQVRKVDNPGGLAMFSIPAGIALASPFLVDDEQAQQ